MSHGSGTERRYFLGGLSEQERDRLEEAYLADAAVYDRLVAVEEELVEDYLAGRLSADDRAGFEQHFLNSPRQRLRVELEEALTQRAARRASAPPRGERGGRPVPVRSWVLAASLLAAAALAVTWTAGGPWLRPETPPPSPTAEASGATTPRPDPPSTARVASLALWPERPRGVQGGAELTLSRGIQVVQLELALTDAAHGAYQAALRTAEGVVVWRGDRLIPGGTRERRRLTASVPAAVLKPGDYVLTLRAGAPPSGAEDVAEYFFRLLEEAPGR